LSDEVAEALAANRPVVALETAVVTHGLPEPQNVEVLTEMESEIRAAGAVPATCLIDSGAICAGASVDAVSQAAGNPRRIKASVRDLAAALVSGRPAGLTVSATIYLAHLVGIHVFATGGIGGVHAGAEITGDVSADLPQLGKSAVITVCSGAKSVLDIPRTLEYLETMGVPVFSYRSDYFPAFYLSSSGIRVSRIESPRDIADTAHAQWDDLGYQAGLVVGNPLPSADAIPEPEWNLWMGRATESARQQGIYGSAVTPYLLARVAEYSGGQTVEANMALLRRNAALAAQIALALST
jgi:pseudouridine-5'-phosphate glycosidase